MREKEVQHHNILTHLASNNTPSLGRYTHAHTPRQDQVNAAVVHFTTPHGSITVTYKLANFAHCPGEILATLGLKLVNFGNLIVAQISLFNQQYGY